MLIINDQNVDSFTALGGLSSSSKAFVEALIASKLEFRFANLEALKKFLQNNQSHFQGAPQKFADVSYQPSFEPIKSVARGPIVKQDAFGDRGKWSCYIDVVTTKSTITVKVFTSVKRHLLTSFLDNQRRPRKGMAHDPSKGERPRNSLVRDELLFESCFRDFAIRLEVLIRARGTLFGVEPKAAEQGQRTAGANIIFETDSLPLTMVPNFGGRPLEVHCYPSDGPGVRSVGLEAYTAITTFLLWFFRTEEYLAEGQSFNYVKAIKPSEQNQLKSKQAKLDKLVENVRRQKGTIDGLVGDLATFTAPTEPPKKAELDKTIGNKAKGPCFLLLKDLRILLIEHGQIPLLDAPSPAAKTKAPGKVATSPKSRSVGSLSNTVRFKTHKAEVSSEIQHLDWVVLAWLLDAHVEVGQLDQIKLIFSDKSPVPKKKATVLQQVADAEKSADLKASNDLKGIPSVVDQVSHIAHLYSLAFKSGVLKLSTES